MTIRQCLVALLTVLVLSPAFAVIDTYQFDSPEQEQRFFTLTNELRCPKCQNQSIGDSNAPIANDLRREVHRMLLEGAENQQIIDFMLDRYGDFVLYRPRLDSKTAVLWFGPLVFLIIGLLAVLMIVRKHRRGAADDSIDAPLTQQQEAQLRALVGETDKNKQGERL